MKVQIQVQSTIDCYFLLQVIILKFLIHIHWSLYLYSLSQMKY